MSNKSSNAMPKDHVITHLAEAANISKRLAGSQLESLELLIHKQLKEAGEFALPGIGRFTVTVRAARRGRNPRNGEAIQIPQKRVVNFRPAKSLNRTVE